MSKTIDNLPENPSPSKPRSRKSSSRKSGSRKAQSDKKSSSWLKYVIVIIVLLIAGGVYFSWFAFTGYKGDGSGEYKWVKIHTGSTDVDIQSTLSDSLGNFGNRVYLLWRFSGAKPYLAAGAYKIATGESALSVARRLRIGAQNPISLVLPGVRTLDMLADRIGNTLEISSKDFLEACDSLLSAEGYTPEQYPAAFLPDKYEMYWNMSAPKTVERLFSYREKFWNDERKEKARKLGLTPVEVVTIASIVEEETAKSDERPKVARLYLNRLDKHMKLQADPTVKFAVGDFGLRRIRGNHLTVESPYNTYINEGLPPGPIRIVERSTIDGVLDAPVHNYLYMCAKEDFSGYHNFAVDYATHLANARRYQAELNRRNIR